MEPSIVRTPTRAAGGVTPEELARMKDHVALWTARAFRTEAIVPERIGPAIEGIYAAAGLKKPRVVIVPSPLVMAFAYGAAAAIWHRRATRAATVAATRAATVAATRAATRAATVAATRATTVAATRAATVAATDATTVAATIAATRAATDAATDAATRAATDAATDAATRAATVAATDAATRAATVAATRAAEKGAAAACFELAGEFGIACAQRWWIAYQGGNMWPAWECYLTAARDILGLKLPAHADYEPWEQAAIEGGFRVMHPEFCMVSDFPEVIRVDAENRPHCEDGPSHRWRDGWSLYHWHGVRIPSHWIEARDRLSAKEVMAERNLEVRRAGIEMLGWGTILQQLKARVIDADVDPEIGTLVEVKLPDVGRARFVRVRCGTGREFAVCVPPETDTALAGQAWMAGLAPMDFTRPEVRS